MACCWDNTRFTRTHTQTHTHTTVERPKQRGRGDQIAEGDRKSVQRPTGPRGPDQQGSSASLSFLHEYNYYLWKFPEGFFFLEQFERSAFIRGKACTSSFGYEKTQLTSYKCDYNLESIWPKQSCLSREPQQWHRKEIKSDTFILLYFMYIFP